jgi:hypothetical protein
MGFMKYKYQSKYKNLGKTKVIRIPENIYIPIKTIIDCLEIIAEKKSIKEVHTLLNGIIDFLNKKLA